MVEKLLAILNALEERYPPVNLGHHALIAGENGSELCLMLALPGAFPTFFIEDADLELTVEEFVVEVAGLVDELVDLEEATAPTPVLCDALYGIDR
jgi:hypothetical protein